MLRGSRPGERRGGRKRHTPNRRTILIDRILSIGLDDPTASRRAFLFKLVKDQKLPADTRMAVASKYFPPKRTQSSRTGRALADIQTTIAQEAVAEVGSSGEVLVPAVRDCNPRALDALLGIVQDATACPKAQKKAALKIAEFLLPKAGKKAKLVPDEYGFSISSSLATAYRDNELKRHALVNEPTRIIPAIAEKIKKLEARSKAIRRWLQVPCPTKYGRDDAIKDCVRLCEFSRLRYNETVLTEEQNAEEAHVRARFDIFATSPEMIARRRHKALEDAERQFKKSRLTGEFNAVRLSRKDRNDLKLLRWLYPKSSLDRSDPEFSDPDFGAYYPYRDHPFQDELLAPDGNFYPRSSKLRPADAADDLLVKVADGPPTSPVSACDTLASDPMQSVKPQNHKLSGR